MPDATAPEPARQASPPPAGCCRAWVRHLPRQEVSCSLAAPADQGCWPAHVRNLSSGGVGLVMGQPLEMGRFVFVELHSAGGTFSRVLLGRVAHCTPHEASSHALGVEFVEELSPGEMRLFLS